MISKILRNFSQVALDFATLNVGNISHYTFNTDFYDGCASCHNPPNLSWLGTGTKYAGWHTPWVG